MKEIDVSPGFVSQAKMMDPAVYQAQRMAELKNMAEYRAKNRAAYEAWSKPEAVKARYEEHAKSLKDAEVKVIKVASLEPRNINTEARILAVTAKKPSLWTRFKAYLARQAGFDR